MTDVLAVIIVVMIIAFVLAMWLTGMGTIIAPFLAALFATRKDRDN